MAEYEQNLASDYSNEWYTPPYLFEEMGLMFGLDPCSPGDKHWVPASRVYTKKDDGLSKEWFGLVFMNPPFGGRNGHLPWLDKFISHGNGVAIVRAYTSSQWFQDYIPQMDGIVFPKGKTKFIKPNGEVGKSPGHGICLLALGEIAVMGIKKINGIYFDIN